MKRIAPLAKRIVSCRQCGGSIAFCRAPGRRQLVAVDALPLTNRAFRIDDTVDPPELLPVEDIYQVHSATKCRERAALRLKEDDDADS